jgi:hypothetical protein
MRTFTDVSILELMPFLLNSPEFFRINTSFFSEFGEVFL